MEKQPPIVKRIINGERAEIFHSSAYGRAQSGSMMGAASTESFAERQKIEQNRQNIRKYGDSMIAEQRFNPEAAGQSRLDQSAMDKGGSKYYEETMKAVKEGMKADLGETQKVLAEARERTHEAENRAKMAAGQRRGLNAEKTERANLYNTAEKRAEMSARYAGNLRPGTGAAARPTAPPTRPPAAPIQMRQIPKIGPR